MEEKSDALCQEENQDERENRDEEQETSENVAGGGDADYTTGSCSELTATALDALISEATSEEPPPSDISSGSENTVTTDTLPSTESLITREIVSESAEEPTIHPTSENTAEESSIVADEENTKLVQDSSSSTDKNEENSSEEADHVEDVSMEAATEPTVPEQTASEETPSEETVPEETPSEEIAPAPEHSFETKIEKEKSPLCDLEEELKRLHGGDEAFMESPKNDESVIPKDALESVGLVEKKQVSADDENKLMEQKRLDMADQPIIKVSDLEEMLAADDVLKDAEVIKKSQLDLHEYDLLICGNCHDAFHFIEEFQLHKTSPCSPSNVAALCESEPKPQVWGFTLWKNKQQKVIKKKGEQMPSSWIVYQKWCKLPDAEKNSWVSAGQTLQYFNKIGNAKLAEVKKNQKLPDKDPLALDGFDSNKENSGYDSSKSIQAIRTVRVNKDIAIMPDQKNNENTNKALRTVRSTETREYGVERIVAKRFNPKRKTWEYQIKWEHFPPEENSWEPVANLSHCKQMVEQFEVQLKKLKMEKAKQQQQQMQLAKVKGRASFTVPGSSNLDSPGGRPQRTSKQKALDQVKQWCGNISDEDEGGRGTKRQHDEDDSDDSFEKKMKWEEMSEDSEEDIKPTVKAAPKKVEQVIPKTQQMHIIKNGVGKGTPLPQNILIPDANGVVRINQKQLPNLSTGVYIMSKTAGIIKLDSTTSKVTTSGGQTVVKVAPKIGQTQIKIVKKDSGNIGGQQLIQVQPKGGIQQAIKVGQKGGVAINKIITPTKITPPVKVYKPVITKVKRVSSSEDSIGDPVKKATMDIVKKSPEVKKVIETAAKATAKAAAAAVVKTPKVEVKKSILSRSISNESHHSQEPLQSLSACEDESDDGLEELPFPDEIKVPEPESPPGDFTLDPFTGKIAGQEYPEPSPIPEATPDPEEEKTDSLDNIVKLAAADITEEDLKSEAPMDIDEPAIQESAAEQEREQHPIEEETEKTKASPLVIRKADVAGSTGATPIRTVVRTSTASVMRRQPSILNQALTTSAPKRATIVHPGARIVQQRGIVRGTTVLNPIVRPVMAQQTYQRTRPVAPRPRHIVQKVVRQQIGGTPQKVYYTKVAQHQQQIPGPSMTRRIGSTTIRSTPIVTGHSVSGKSPAGPVRVVQTVVGNQTKYKYVQKVREPQHTQQQLLARSQAEKRLVGPGQRPKPKSIISMPSLSGDEDTASQLDHGNISTNQDSVNTTIKVTAATEQESSEGAAVEAEAETDKIQTEKQEHSESVPSANTLSAGELGTFTLADSENPIFITGDDGTVYQVAGQNEQGQTILLTQGADGQQQCLLVTNELADALDSSGGSTSNSAEESQQQEQPSQQQQQQTSMPDINPDVTEPLSIKTNEETSPGEDQVVAQVVRTEPPSPGGTHKVVVMLPDGNLMMTQVSPEEYASLELE